MGEKQRGYSNTFTNLIYSIYFTMLIVLLFTHNIEQNIIATTCYKIISLLMFILRVMFYIQNQISCIKFRKKKYHYLLVYVAKE